MDESIGVGNSFFASLFFHVEAGSEKDVVEKLRALGYVNLFKVLGQHDIVAFFDVNDFESNKIYNSCQGVRTAKPLTAFNFVTDYRSPDIAQWCSDAPVLGFIFLELDKWFYSEESGAHSSLSAYSTLIKYISKKGEDNGIELAIYGGFGRTELYIIVKSTNFDNIAKITSFCRNLTSSDCFTDTLPDDENLPVFVNTNTIPCVSFSEINYLSDGVEVTNIEGNISAYISVNCPSGFEQYVYQHFSSKELYECSGLLGDEDVIIKANKVSSKDFLEDLLAFREYWELTHNAPLSTSTTLQIDAPNSAYEPKIYRIQQSKLELKIPENLKKNNLRLANRIQSFVHKLDSYYGNRSHQFLVVGVVGYLSYMRLQLDNYQKINIESFKGKVPIQESKLLEAIEYAEVGLSQRLGSSFNSKYPSNELPLPFSDGIFASLVALEYFINFIFNTWSDNTKDYDSKRGANGFPTFNDSSGFQIGWGETINLPLVALYDPSDSRGNWLTLTHEISHAIYVRLNVGIEQAKRIQGMREKYFHDRAIYLSYDDVFEDQFNELFAHWYDYYHFYDLNYARYFEHVWSSWLKLPIVHNNFLVYFFRSFFIFFVSREEELSSQINESPESFMNIALSLWDEHFNKFLVFTSIVPSDLLEDAKNNRDKLLRLFRVSYEFMNIFNSYKNESFRKAINKKYKNIDIDIQSIINGKLVSSEISNPYLLVRDIIFRTHNSGEIRTSTALIMSLKNQGSFYQLVTE